MKQRSFIISLLICANGLIHVFSQKQYVVESPDSQLKTSIIIGDKIEYFLEHENEIMIEKSSIAMCFTNGEVWGKNAKLKHSKLASNSAIINSPFSKSTSINDTYNELTLTFINNWGIKFRVYNDGMAYRFFYSHKDSFQVKSEEVSFKFPSDYKALIPYVSGSYAKQDVFQSSFESLYTQTYISDIEETQLMFLPILVENDNGKKICITEADLESYPGMYLKKDTNNNLELKGVFAAYPASVEQGGHNMLQKRVLEREQYIARISRAREFPWRVAIVATDDKQLVRSDMVYRLASPTRIQDLSWIKPGKVAWEWWNNWNIYGVDFKAGINNDTYKYYIDFASKNNIEYVILDEGWAVNLKADLFQVIPEIDLQELIDYANERNVGIILWAGYWALDRDLEKVCKHYSEMGVKGFKVDFMDRDDQLMVDFIYRASAMAAKYKLILDYHGVYKPTGLQRTYPNVLNFEGVFGLEQLKWSPTSTDMVTYDVTVPFIRMVAGPMDYTQGAMRNAAKGNFRPINSEPMSQGTRCRQLALYVIFESPLTMLCDSPKNYERELESLEFISKIPTVWDESIVINCKVTEYLTLARRSGNTWYIGGITNWNEKYIEIDLSFLSNGNYKVTLFTDGINADKIGIDYTREETIVTHNERLKIHMAPGGGFVARLEKI